jgi:hypothetical protein
LPFGALLSQLLSATFVWVVRSDNHPRINRQSE